MSPPNVAGGHPAAEPDSRPQDDSAAATAPNVDVILTDGPGNGEHESRRRKFPLAFASQAEPGQGRSQYGLMYQCGACGGTHFGRSPVELTTGKRLARCGRVVWLVIARTYRARADHEAAA